MRVSRKIILLLPIFLLLLPVRVLEIQTGGRSCTILLGKAELEVDYIHSVSLTKVCDIYIVNGSGIYAVEQKWQQFDAGQPISYDKVENGFFIKKLDLYMGTSLDYGFASLNNATVYVNGRFVTKAEDRLRFDVENLPLAMLVANGCS